MTSPSKNSSKGAPEDSQRQARKDRTSIFSKFICGGRKGKPGESNSSTDVKKEVPSQGPDGKTVFKPKHLTICWEGDSQFWSIPEGDGPAELLAVCWLDVSGKMDVTKGNTYEVSFMLSMNTETSSGWDDPVMVMARIGEKGKYKSEKIYLSELKGEIKEFPPDKCRIEYKSDEKAKNDKETLYFGLYEVWTNKWKGGLRIHEAIVQEMTAGNNASTSIPVPASEGNSSS